MQVPSNSSPPSEPDPGNDDNTKDIAALRKELGALKLEASVTESQMARVFQYLAGLYDLIPGLLIVIDRNRRVTRANPEAEQLLGFTVQELRELAVERLLPGCNVLLKPFFDGRVEQSRREEAVFLNSDREEVPVLLSIGAQYDEEGEVTSLLLVGLDLREQKRLEMDLRHAQKLESLGQLAAGVAHEINTPMQFISDNLHFIELSASDLMAVAEGRRSSTEVDIEFLKRRLPRAVERAKEGVARVSRIVGAMRLFAHPGVSAEPVDVNVLVENAVTVSMNSFKYIADLDLVLGEVPTILGVRGDLGQVLLNLITNAAHAMETRFGDSGQRGMLRVETRFLSDRGQVEIRVEDNGSGIPDEVAHRVFDPFFTTKPVGKGTGQGLAISRSIVVDKHGGELSFEHGADEGTRFLVRLPLLSRAQGG